MGYLEVCTKCDPAHSDGTCMDRNAPKHQQTMVHEVHKSMGNAKGNAVWWRKVLEPTPLLLPASGRDLLAMLGLHIKR